MTLRIGIWNDATVARFRDKQIVRGDDECWAWSASFKAKGYGQFVCPVRRRPISSSRFALELHLGRELRPGRHALHTCDNPPCTNPAHLYEGTLSDNTQDSLRRGRFGNGKGQSFNVGSRNGNAKLTEADIRAIRSSDLPCEELAATYSITESNLDYILRGKTWRHVS